VDLLFANRLLADQYFLVADVSGAVLRKKIVSVQLRFTPVPFGSRAHFGKLVTVSHQLASGNDRKRFRQLYDVPAPIRRRYSIDGRRLRIDRPLKRNVHLAPLRS
jgi:hypothetical protein